VREIRMLRAMRRALETGLRKFLTGHESGNAGHRQGISFGSPRQCSTLPGWKKACRRRSLCWKKRVAEIGKREETAVASSRALDAARSLDLKSPFTSQSKRNYPSISSRRDA
jgi:hypothetical protein